MAKAPFLGVVSFGCFAPDCEQHVDKTHAHGIDVVISKERYEYSAV